LNSKFYIGVHDGEESDKYLGSGILINKAVKKYGAINFSREILQTFDSLSEAYDYEKTIVTEDLIQDPNCYNLAVGGKGGCLGGSENQKQIARELGFKNKGRVHTEVSRKRIAAGLKGRKHSEETKKKIGIKHKGKVLSASTKEKIRVSRSGSVDSEDTKLKKSDAAKRLNKDMGLMRDKNYQKVKCPHCGKTGGINGMKRFHFSKCKNLKKS
jgi:hypothetical protein